MSVRLSLLTAGSCVHPRHVVLRGGALRGWRPGRGPELMTFPAMFALIEHPRRGVTLYDTGYGEAFFAATRRFPERIYRWITPVDYDPAQGARAQLAARGIGPRDVERVIVSHFHADHIGALLEFPAAEILYGAGATAGLGRASRLEGLRQGFLPELLPPDFAERARAIAGPRVLLPPECAPFVDGIDLFGDRSLIAVELPGHAAGQVGLFVAGEPPTLLVADAAWHVESIRGPVMPHPITRLLFADHRDYAETLEKLHTLEARRDAPRVVPSHCAETLARYAS